MFFISFMVNKQPPCTVIYFDRKFSISIFYHNVFFYLNQCQFGVESLKFFLEMEDHVSAFDNH